MNAQFSPIVSEFESAEQEANYNAWFTAKVEASLKDPRPSIPHDRVMAKMDAIIAAAEQRRKTA